MSGGDPGSAKLAEPPVRPRRAGLIGEVYVDLFLEHLKAKGAEHRVTQRAQMFLELGVPRSEVLRALECDEAGYTGRVAAWEAWRAENRAAADRMRERVS